MGWGRTAGRPQELGGGRGSRWQPHGEVHAPWPSPSRVYPVSSFLLSWTSVFLINSQCPLSYSSIYGVSWVMPALGSHLWCWCGQRLHQLLINHPRRIREGAGPRGLGHGVHRILPRSVSRHRQWCDSPKECIREGRNALSCIVIRVL